MEEPRDRSAELKTATGKLEIERGDFCDAFEQEPDRLFSARECWYCKFGDFGIFTELPLITGICNYKTTMNGTLDSCAKRRGKDLAVLASKKQEEE